MVVEMAQMVEPDDDTMSDRLEEAVRDLLLANSTWDPIKVVFRGDPGDTVPVRLFPYGIVFLTDEAAPLGESGYDTSTGPLEDWRYDGYIETNVLIPDASSLVPDVDRKANVASYLGVKKYAKAARRSLLNWGPEPGIITNLVLSADSREYSSGIVIDRVQTGLAARGVDNVANLSIVTFHIITRRMFITE